MGDKAPGARILLVEDAEEISSLLEYLLRRAGFSVSTARDGKEALAFIEREPPADLAVLLENLGYRQLTSFWRLRGLYQWLFRRKAVWGEMKRSGAWQKVGG